MIENLVGEDLCLCGYGREVPKSNIREIRYCKGHVPKSIPNHYPCACGCGELVDLDKKCIFNHSVRKGTYCTEEHKQRMRHPKSEQGRLNIKAAKNTPEAKAKQSIISKEIAARPGYKEKQSVIQKIVQNLPEVKAKALQGQKIANAKPEVHERRSKAATECQNRPEVKAKQSKIQKVIQKEVAKRPDVLAKKAKVLADPEFHEKMSKSAKESSNRPEVKAKKSASYKELWQDQEFRKNHSGENASNWQGGKSFEVYPEEFNNDLKECIRERDGFHCRNCFDDKNRLHVHHIDYDKKNNLLDNLITLCLSCHMKTNVSKKNRAYWTDFYRVKVIPISEIYRHFPDIDKREQESV